MGDVVHAGGRVGGVIGEVLATTNWNATTAPLHVAPINKNCAAAKALLNPGVRVDPQDKWGNTPFWRAVFGKDGTVQLVEHCADATIENDSGNSPTKLAQRLEKPDYLALFERSHPSP